jgi:hypothetical protein
MLKSGVLHTTGGKVKIVQILYKTVLRLHKDFTIEVLYDPVISLLGIYPEY